MGSSLSHNTVALVSKKSPVETGHCRNCWRRASMLSWGNPKPITTGHILTQPNRKKTKWCCVRHWRVWATLLSITNGTPPLETTLAWFQTESYTGSIGLWMEEEYCKESQMWQRDVCNVFRPVLSRCQDDVLYEKLLHKRAKSRGPDINKLVTIWCNCSSNNLM